MTTFTSEGKVRIYDPTTNSTVESEIPNTIGTAKCSSSDQSKCELVGVGLSETGSFQGGYDLPTAFTSTNSTLNQLN